MGSLEARIVEAMWEMGDGTVRDVLEEINADNSRELAYNTVMTVMARLASKGVFLREREGRAYRYEPALDPRGLIEKQVADRAGSIFESYGDMAWPIIVREAQKAGVIESDGR